MKKLVFLLGLLISFNSFAEQENYTVQGANCGETSIYRSYGCCVSNKWYTLKWVQSNDNLEITDYLDVETICEGIYGNPDYGSLSCSALETEIYLQPLDARIPDDCEVESFNYVNNE